MRIHATVPLTVALASLLAVPAAAAPPANDSPAAAAQFEPYTAEDGVPAERQGIAELVEAQADPGVPRCLGETSFARTVWYWVPGTETPRELAIEASGRTLDPIDLAAFVQPLVTDAPVTALPNVCAGLGAGGSDIAPDRTSALTLRVPAHHAVFIQVGRRGPVGSADDERAVLSLAEIPLEALSRPGGDEAGPTTQRIRRSGRARISLGGATTTPEDPAVPACPSLAGVWRRVRVRATGVWAITAQGADASVLSAFAGRSATSPNPRGFRGCVDRDGPGPMLLPVRARRGQWLWIRVGTDRPPPFSEAFLGFRRAGPRDEESGGGCLASPRPRIGGALVGTPAARIRNRARTVALRVNVSRGPVCAAIFEMVGPRARVYARDEVPIVRGRRQAVRLRRVRRLRPGRYRVRVEAAGLGGIRRTVPSTIRFGLRSR